MSVKHSIRITALAAASVLTLSACAAGDNGGAPDYPTRPVELVVGFGAGGALDLVARALAENVPDDFGQITVINIDGAGGTIGAADVFSAAPNGYRAYLGAVATMAIQPWREGSEVPYAGPDTYRPVLQMLYFPQVLAVPAGAPYDTPEEFLDYVRSNPGAVRIGTGGVGTLPHIALEMLQDRADVELSHVPFQGFSESVPALLGGSIEGIIATPADVTQHVEAGLMKIVGSFTEGAVESLPEVSSFAEAGVDYVQDNYYFVLLPEDTPDDVVGALHDALKSAMDSEAFAQFADTRGAILQYLGPEEITAKLDADYHLYEEIVHDLGL